LVNGFCCAAGFKAQDAKRDGGAAIEWCAHCWANRKVVGRLAVLIASRTVGHKSQYWAEAPKGEVVHNATSFVDPVADRAVRTSSQRERPGARVVHYSTTTRPVHVISRAPAGMGQTAEAGLSTSAPTVGGKRTGAARLTRLLADRNIEVGMNNPSGSSGHCRGNRLE
jgi:hypothetical protein